MAAGHGEPSSHSVWAEETIRRRPRVRLAKPEVQVAVVDDAGWVTCPACGFRFKQSDQNAWDGARHRRCLQRLRLGTPDPRRSST